MLKKPTDKPKNPRFSCGPTRKHPGWDIKQLNTESLGRNHRSDLAVERLSSALEHCGKLMELPHDWNMAIMPGSNTGAFEIALWNMLGAKSIDVFAWESFSYDWLVDIQQELKLESVNYYTADYGDIADLNQANPDNDIVFVYNGTTSGVCVPNMDWVQAEREGLVFCDATSAVFAKELDYTKLDVVTWSWQKILGGEAGLGMLALSPKAIERLQNYPPSWPIPKLFRLKHNGKINVSLFKGQAMNTLSLLAVEDLYSSLNWSEDIGGRKALKKRCEENFQVIKDWIEQTDWIDFLAKDPKTQSVTSVCLKIIDKNFTQKHENEQRALIKEFCSLLEKEQVAYDISAYRKAPPGIRIWTGATVEKEDLENLLPWLDWAYKNLK